MEHEGRAVVFENARGPGRRASTATSSTSTADDVLVLKNIGPKGAPGMPEAGYIPIPRKLARAGVKDMVRISDGRMSGTAFGTIVLHVTPESAIGGPLAHVRNGDRIRLSVARRETRAAGARRRTGAPRAGATPVTEPTRRARLSQALPAIGDAGRQGRGLRLSARGEEAVRRYRLATATGICPNLQRAASQLVKVSPVRHAVHLVTCVVVQPSRKPS